MANFFTTDETALLPGLIHRLSRAAAPVSHPNDLRDLREVFDQSIANGLTARNRAGLNAVIHNLQTALLLCEKMSPDRNMLLAVMLFPLVYEGKLATETLTARWGADVASLVEGRLKVAGIYGKQASVESENFRKLLLTFAEDIRVIIIMIVDRLALMRAINHHPNERMVRDIAAE